MPKYKKFTQEEENTIIEKYLQGVSINALRKEFHVRSQQISVLLKNKNVFSRNRKSKVFNSLQMHADEIIKLYTIEHWTLKMLAEKFGCCVSSIKEILQSNNIQINSYSFPHKDISLRQDYFEEIDNEFKAYFLGLIFADGNIYNNMLSIEIHARDLEILQIFKDQINTINKISYRKKENTETVCLRIVSNKIVQDLSKYGIVPDKTHKIKHLPSNIPEKFLKDYIRGLIDGDGWITIDKSGYCHVGFVSNYQSTVEDFKKYIEQLLGTNISSHVIPKDKKRSGFALQITRKDYTKQLMTVLYKDNKVCLTRKYKKAELIFEDKNDEDIV